MNRFLLFISAILLLSSCSHRIYRSGYKVNKSSYSICDVAIRKNFDNTGIDGEKLGYIVIQESGFSTRCNEEDAILLLRGEACALGADLVVINEEWRPGRKNTCYGCRASFYKANSTYELADDPEFTPEEIHQRVISDQKRSTGTISASVISGVLLGFLMFLY